MIPTPPPRRSVRVLLVLALLMATSAVQAVEPAADDSQPVAEASALPDVAAPVETTEEDDSPFEVFSSDQPIHIQSDELEVISEGKNRRLVFTRNVRVEQGEVELLTAQLEAFYPEGASDPETLHAEGDVRVREGDRTVRCRSASYERASGIVVCTGDAIFIQGCDEVRGDKIEFDTERERVKVIGGAHVVIQRDDEADRDCSREGAQ